MNKLGSLIVISGPSGTGKTTLARQACLHGQRHFSISCTTRAPRPGEIHGQDYFFLSKTEFEDKIQANAMFEYAKVHDHYYGTLKSQVRTPIQQGIDVIMDIDVQGGAQVRNTKEDWVIASHADLFVLPPSMAELENRLRSRGTDAEEIILKRLHNAQMEIQQANLYQFILHSTTREADQLTFQSFLTTLSLRTSLQPQSL
jgi:guanylate kinase